ncbi:MAG: uracil-DNA glycosylase [Terriglobia bacterium]
MDDTTRKELRAWLEFYQELGIEGFYRRDANSVESLPALEAARPAPTAVAPPAEPAAAPKLVPSSLPPRVAAASAPPKPAVPPAHPPGVISPPASSFNLFEAAPARRSGPETLEQIRQDLGDCRRCKLAPTRKTIVFGDGNPHAELVFIGEGPGADEDEQGLPFVGRAGKLLNRMMQTVGLKREDVYICNVVKCRPPGNRTPEKDEVDACSPFLYRQIEAIKPRLICCLGAPAVRTVLGIKEGITKIRGQFYDFGSTKALATVHPAYVLRNPREEKILREDFEKIREFLKKP